METIRVSELASQIKKTITGYFNTYVNVQGEASNVKLSGRNLYFSLKNFLYNILYYKDYNN